jgi:cyclic beta-1,2-glucan synthetase
MDNSAALSPQLERNAEIYSKNLPSPQENIGEFLSASPAYSPVILCSCAFDEVGNWEDYPVKKRCSLLGRKWQRAFESIQVMLCLFDRSHAEGVQLSRESEMLVENARLLQTALIETRQSKALRELPQIVRNMRMPMPRIYATALGYLEAVSFAYDTDSFSAYLEAVQQKVLLRMSELHAVRSMLQLVLLEQIARIQEMLPHPDRGEMQPSSKNYLSDLSKWIDSLREISEEDWQRLVEKSSRLDLVLREDPAAAYSNMDFETRALYLKAIADLAKHSDMEEIEVARKAIALARSARSSHFGQRSSERRNHVGYFLIENGRRILEEQIGYRAPLLKRLERLILAHPQTFYLGGIFFTTSVLLAFLLNGLRIQTAVLAALAFLLLPATESAVGIMNGLVSLLVRPRALPRLDFSKGIPAECITLTVVPSLLLNEEHTQQIVQDLEIRYLANRDANLHFALLTDSPDSSCPLDDKKHLVDLCSQLILNLNKKYVKQGKGSFFLFHRHPMYNPSEETWMGWERKRGKLLDLNNLLRNCSDSFPVKIGDLSILHRVRYVITLDSDTQLPKDSATKLVGTLAHPLNRAVIDSKTNTVVEGYSILQPRVGINVKSVVRSRLASLLSGETGFDIYTRAVSDVYQDLFGEGNFTGKGIYEVDTFQQVLGERFPCNALLSHDLIEGTYARAGLVSDIELIDDYPSHFSAFCRRKHRWVRGDWQIILWLLPKVPDYFERWVPNPLTLISRWKILDNLRRSLIEIAIFSLFLAGWFWLPGKPRLWTMGTLVIILIPSYFHCFHSLIESTFAKERPDYWNQIARPFIDKQVNVFLVLAFLSHQVLVMMDAIVRTIVRLTVTRRKLLEWETAAQSESGICRSTPVDIYLGWTPWLSIGIGLVLAFKRPEALPAALPLLGLWSVSKFLCRWLNLPALEPRPAIDKEDEFFLRCTTLRTWRYFRQFSNADMKWLIPDNVQASPCAIVARLSPTNLGLLLDARIAAYELGYITLKECIRDTRRSLSSARQLQRFKGHLFNWYDIRTMKTLPPYFVSTVDSGNLAGSLWTLKQACLEMGRQPLLRPQLWLGIRDHLNLIAQLVEREGSQIVSTDAIRTLGTRLELLSNNVSLWPQVWPSIEQESSKIASGLLNGTSESRVELRWWADELLTRIRAARKMVDDFIPWLLPEHGLLLDHSELQLTQAEELTLNSLSAFLRKLDLNLEKLSQRRGSDLRIKRAIDSLRTFLPVCLHNTAVASENLQGLALEAEMWVEEMDFRFLYNSKRRLLSVGYDVINQCLTKSCYDLLASESRIAAFIAVAKGDVPQESWFRLGRAHTMQNGKPILLSWAGSMFEYLMPSLWMRSYPNTILEQSLRAVVQSQQEFGKRNHVPWGISEAACSKRDEHGHYQYRAYGLPELSLKRRPLTEIVVSPYSSSLALTVDPLGVIGNLRCMAKMMWFDEFGFYESIHFPKIGSNHDLEVVRCWMAHHQGMALAAQCNFLTEASLQRHFHHEPMVKANEEILHEKLPKSLRVHEVKTPKFTSKIREKVCWTSRLLPTLSTARTYVCKTQKRYTTPVDLLNHVSSENSLQSGSAPSNGSLVGHIRIR